LHRKLKDPIMHSLKSDMLINRIPSYSKETTPPGCTSLSFNLLIQVVYMGCFTKWFFILLGY